MYARTMSRSLNGAMVQVFRNLDENTHFMMPLSLKHLIKAVSE